MRVGLVLSILCLCGGTTVRAQETDWGNWKSTPNFAGIQIRSRCQSHSSSEGVSDWNYQIRSTYKERVYITYKDEERASTPSHIIFGTPGSFYLNAGEESPVHDDYVAGDCNRDGGVYIAVISVETGNGKERSPSGGAASGSVGAEAGAAKGSGPGAAMGTNSLIGTWISTNKDGPKVTTVYSADGSFSFRFHLPDGTSDGFTGSWTESGDSVTIAPESPTGGLKKVIKFTARFIDARHLQWTGGPDPNDSPIWERAADK